MNREQAHELVDKIFDQEPESTPESAPETPHELPKDKRVVRTKSTGDRVYLVDETAKTKAWVTSPDILEKLGFSMADVQDVDDKDLIGYAMTASVYKVE